MAHFLIIELPGGNDTDILQTAIQRGDTFTLLSADLSHYQRQAHVLSWLAQAHDLIEVPSFGEAEIEQSVLQAHHKKPFDAVLCLLDIRLIESARIAQTLGLRYLSPASAVLLRDKFNVRVRLQDCGITQPAFALATSNTELQAAVDRIGLPVLIKPADGYGSQNVVLLESALDLDPFLSPLEDMLPSRADYGLGVKANDRLMVEQYMQGMVIGCDTLTQGGQHQLLGINEKLFFDPPSFAIRGGCFTPNNGQFKAVEEYVFRLLDAVQFNCGAAHIELMLTQNGLQLIEINPRLVGAKIPRLISLALGRSVLSDLMDVHLGQPLPVLSAKTNVAVTRWLVSHQTGIIDRIELAGDQHEHIGHVEMLKKTGDSVRPPMENADRIGYVMACAPDRAQAEQSAEHYVSASKLVLQADE